MNTSEKKAPILVLGGNGKTGRRVMDRLRADGHAVIGASRSTTPSFDWHSPDGWADVLEGVGAVYITYQPDLAVPGAVEAIETLAETALKVGVRRLVLLSGRGEEEALRAEQALQTSGADWTIVRAGWFSQNFSENFLIEGVLAGEVALPTNGTKEPFVDADDIADVVVAALTDDRHIGEVYEVTGPRLMSFPDVIGEIAAASGRDIRFTEVPANDYRAVLEQQNLPEDLTWLIMYLFETVLDGRNEHVTDGVERALGRPPKDFSAYARETAATGVWAA